MAPVPGTEENQARFHQHGQQEAAGTTAAPGKNVLAKSGLNKSSLDQGWFEFRRQLDYKLAWNGGWFVAVPSQNTSRTCPCCGHVSANNRRSQAGFECVVEENADVLGALNILSRGMQLMRDEGQDTVDASAGCARTARIACEVSGAVMPPAAGTHRSVVEIPGLWPGRTSNETNNLPLKAIRKVGLGWLS